MMSNDNELVHRAQLGDRKAFAMLVERYERPIFNLAYRMVHDPDDAADITQNAFVKAFRRLDTFNPDYKFFNWIYRIAANDAINHLRRQKPIHELAHDPPSNRPLPDDDCHRHETSDLVTRALTAMPLDQRIVVILKHLIFLSYRDIAAILEIPEKTVKSRLFSARQALREQLVKQGYER